MMRDSKSFQKNLFDTTHILLPRGSSQDGTVNKPSYSYAQTVPLTGAAPYEYLLEADSILKSGKPMKIYNQDFVVLGMDKKEQKYYALGFAGAATVIAAPFATEAYTYYADKAKTDHWPVYQKNKTTGQNAMDICGALSAVLMTAVAMKHYFNFRKTSKNYSSKKEDIDNLRDAMPEIVENLIATHPDNPNRNNAFTPGN